LPDPAPRRSARPSPSRATKKHQACRICARPDSASQSHTDPAPNQPIPIPLRPDT
jgi:hypothetical protein